MNNEKLFLRILLFLALAGAAVSVWLLTIHIELITGTGSLESSCSIFTDASSGCEEIALSPFSKVWIFPLAGIALGYYIALMSLFVWSMQNVQTRFEPLYTAFNLATVAIIVTMVMAFISRFIVGGFCVGCAALWLINLCIWPVLVKALGLHWGNALMANGETFSHKDMQLNFPRVKSAYILATVLVLGAAGFSTAVESNTKAKYNSGALNRGILKYTQTSPVFLPEEAFEGPSAKGAKKDKAILKIVKFSDFQCPACKKASQAFKPFFLKNKDRVLFVYRHFPLDSTCNPNASGGNHLMACTAAAASYCAGKKGMFQNAHNRIFDKQEDLSKEWIDEEMKRLGIDTSCLTDKKTKESIERDIAWGASIDVNSTPTYWVNGRKMGGGLSPEQWQALLDFVAKQEKK